MSDTDTVTIQVAPGATTIITAKGTIAEYHHVKLWDGAEVRIEDDRVVIYRIRRPVDARYVEGRPIVADVPTTYRVMRNVS